jgi:hypothetical protein
MIGLIFPSDLPVCEKTLKFFNIGIIVMIDLPTDEKHKDFSVWSNSYGRFV